MLAIAAQHIDNGLTGIARRLIIMNQVREWPLAARAPAQAEHLYYTSTDGHLFAATSIQFPRMRLPWYGMVSVSMDSPMKVATGGQTFEGYALAMFARDLKFVSTPTRYISIVVNPLHRNFRDFTLLDPHVRVLDRDLFSQFDALGAQAIDGSLSTEAAGKLCDDIQAVAQPLLADDSKLDERGRILVRELWQNPGISIGELAERLNLSYHRTSHLFVEAVGIPVRTYQLWQKLYRSCGPLLAGASLTEVAHTAGFVDSAHYSSTFHKAYGRAPSEMFRSPRVTLHSTAPVCTARAAPNPLNVASS
jgi:AraC-like DNA-binding protein